jgi:hypothetical protein
LFSTHSILLYEKAPSREYSYAGVVIAEEEFAAANTLKRLWNSPFYNLHAKLVEKHKRGEPLISFWSS